MTPARQPRRGRRSILLVATVLSLSVLVSVSGWLTRSDLSTDADAEGNSSPQTGPGALRRGSGAVGPSRSRAFGAAPQQDPGDPEVSEPTATALVRVTSISPWVESDGEFQMKFLLAATVPPDAQLTYTVHQAISRTSNRSVRNGVSAIIQGGQPGRVLQAPVTSPVSHFSGGADGSVLSIPVRSRTSSDRTRAFLPGSGIHPVSIVITAPDGPELWSSVVFLNHLPRDFATPSSKAQPLTVSLLTPVRTAPVATSGTPEFQIADRTELEALVSLLKGAPAAPLKVLLRGDAIAGLQRSDERWAREALSALEVSFEKSTTEDSDTAPRPAAASLLRAPFVPVDTEGMIKADGADALRAEVDLGAEFANSLSERPVINAAWVMDDHLGPASATALESLGFSEVVVAPTQLANDDRRTDGRLTRPPQHLSGTRSMRVTAFDEELSAYLAEDEVDPVNRSHDVVAALVADWFDLNSGRDVVRGAMSALVVQPKVDAEVVASLASAFSDSGPLRNPPEGSVLAAPVRREDNSPVEAKSVALKAPAPGDGTTRAVRDFEQTAETIASFRSAAPEEPLVDTWRLRNAESLAVSLPSSSAAEVHLSIRSQIAERAGAIVPPPPRRTLLASRDNTIPLRFRNELDYDVTLALHARSPRLDIGDGDTTRILLRPGENRIDLPVTVRAPGESLLRLRLTTPDDGLDIASFDIPVQSTAISGVGAALSAVSVLFILLWWARTFFRQRRDDAKENSAHPSTAPSQQ